MIRSIFLATVVVLAGMAWAQAARAEMVLADQTTLVRDLTAHTVALTIDEPGTLTARIGDARFTAVLASLTLTVTDARGQVAGSNGAFGLAGPGTCLFELGRGTYFAHLLADAGGRLGLGAFTLLLTFHRTEPPVVPLPPAFLLLGSGLAALACRARARRQPATAG